jgi:hypothetical protein
VVGIASRAVKSQAFRKMGMGRCSRRKQWEQARVSWPGRR